MQVKLDEFGKEVRHAGPVYLKTGPISAISAYLIRTSSELVLVTEAGERFRVPLSLVGAVEFPWWYFGGGMWVTVDGTRYVLSFSPPARVEDEESEWIQSYEGAFKRVASVRRSSEEWKAALSDLGNP